MGKRGAVHIFVLRSSRNRVDLLSYESKPTDKPKQYDWMAEKNWTGAKLNNNKKKMHLAAHSKSLIDGGQNSGLTESG